LAGVKEGEREARLRWGHRFHGKKKLENLLPSTQAKNNQTVQTLRPL